MFIKISKQNENKLWPHQVKALDFVIKHLNAHESPCLIRMPTGTGKTGVIACLSMLSNQNSTLILTPWANLREQLTTNLTSDFWNVTKIKPNKIDIVELFPSNSESLISIGKPLVFVATFATLNEIRKEHKETYEKLQQVLSLIIVDEGHYEPAVEWGKSVKGLRTKTVLLTATPYRNDLKLFRITNPDESTHHYTHKSALKDGIIRELKFEEFNCKLTVKNFAEKFCEKWKELTKNKILPSLSPRAIVCCSCKEDIEEAVTIFRRNGLNAIGIHDRFKNNVQHLLKDVPDPLSIDSEIWVHQNKLTEGIDDNRFCCIGLFTKIRNDRKLVQQIGRILRKSIDDQNQPALIFSPNAFLSEEAWGNYLDFEPNLELLDPQHFKNVVDQILSSQPQIEYFEGHFRRRFDYANLSENPQVIIPPSVIVRVLKPEFSISEYIEECTDTLNTEDAIILGKDMNKPCIENSTNALWVYASIRNSHNLQNTSLYEISLQTHCVVISSGLVFLSDSDGIYPSNYIEDHTTSISIEQLSRFLDRDFSPTNVCLSNSIPYENVIRSTEIRSNNILKVPSSLTDHIHICRSIRGTSKESGRRYIGLMNSRVKKEVSREVLNGYDFENFIKWVNNTARILTKTTSKNELFNRYMKIINPPSNPIPKIISLDLMDDDLNLTLVDGTDCILKNYSSEINQYSSSLPTKFKSKFLLEKKNAENLFFEMRIEYQADKKRFWFYKDEGSTIRISRLSEGDTIPKSFTEFLNQNQELITISLDDGQTIYQGRNFYSIDYSYGEQVLLGLIEQPNNSIFCFSEKGTQIEIEGLKNSGSTSFPQNSLFKAIAEREFALPFNDELLICEDLGSECADFIAANFGERKLALIHAKAGKGSGISASAFHDVVAQAMKNLTYLSRNNEIPKGVNSWSEGEKWFKTSIPRLYRFSQDFPTKKDLWEKIRKEIIETSNPSLYVILLTTGCCDLGKLKNAINDPKYRTPETSQLLHLLDGLHGYSRQLGVNLILYDLPYKNQ